MSSITDLPEDLLVPIFSLARESPLDLLELAQVCSDWKRIVYSTGALFAEITAGTDYDTDVSFDQLSRVLALSKEAPLHLIIRCLVEADYNIACAAILRHIGHICELEFYVDVLEWKSQDNAPCPLKSAFSVPAPMLEDLLIDFDGGHMWAVVDYQLFDGSAPRLTRLQLYGAEIANGFQPALSRIEYFFGPGAISDTAASGTTALVAHAVTLCQLFPALVDLTLTDCTSFLAVSECDSFPTHLDAIDIRYCRELRDDESDEIETGGEALRGLQAANWRGASSIAIAYPPEGLVPLILDDLSSGADAIEGVDFGNSTDIGLAWSCLVFYTKSTKVLRFTDIPDEDMLQLAASSALRNVDDVTFGPTVMDDLSNWNAPQFLSRFFDTARNVTQLNIIVDHFPARTELLSGWKLACSRACPDHWYIPLRSLTELNVTARSSATAPVTLALAVIDDFLTNVLDSRAGIVDSWRIPVRNLTDLNVTARSSATAPVLLGPAVLDDFLTNVLDFGAPDRKLHTLFLHYVHLTCTSNHAHTVLSPHVLMCLELPDPFCNDA